MILIADSGSTKTDWVLKNNETLREYTSEGLNPKIKSESIMAEEIKGVFSDTEINQKVSAIYFYGAGCAGEFYQSKVKTILELIFPNAKVDVEHDLMGAAKALFGNKKGIACILGTGSNSCLYNGKDIVDNVTSLGYLAGDEGSGFHIGKSLIQAYTYRELGEALETEFETHYQLSRETLVQELYTQSQPNRYIASFSKFCGNHIQDESIQDIVLKAFDQFIKHHVIKYQNYQSVPVGFVGSIAKVFEHYLKNALVRNDITLFNIIVRPIVSLSRFHS